MSVTAPFITDGAAFSLEISEKTGESGAVKSKLELLPQGKQDELAFVIDVIRSGFAHATARRTQPHLRAAKLLKILLFGSYARGDWVDDRVLQKHWEGVAMT